MKNAQDKLTLITISEGVSQICAGLISIWGKMGDAFSVEISLMGMIKVCHVYKMIVILM